MNKKRKKNNKRKRNNKSKGNSQIEISPWNILEHAIHEIYNHNANSLSYAELYRNAYNMVLHNFGEKLYSGLVATMTSHLKEMARFIETKQQGDSFLEELNKKWNDHNKALQLIRDILMYMDRTYVRSTKKTPVYELGLNLWKENVIYSNHIRNRLLSTLLAFVCSERAGEVIDRGLFKNITKMLMDLGHLVYVQEFETPFLQVSAEFYRVESQELIESYDSGAYLKKVERRMNEEKNRVSHYLDPTTEKKITVLVEKEMIENHMLRLIHMENSWLINMLQDDKYEDLGTMYNLLYCVNDGLLKMYEVMERYLVGYIKVRPVVDPRQEFAYSEKLKDLNEVVQRFLNVKGKYDKIIKLALSNDKRFLNGLNARFASIFLFYFLAPVNFHTS